MQDVCKKTTKLEGHQGPHRKENNVFLATITTFTIYPIRNYLCAGFVNHNLKLEYLYSFLPSHWNRERYVLTIMRKRTIQITIVAHYFISDYSKACWDGKNGYLLLKILKSHELLGPACSTNWSVHVPFK